MNPQITLFACGDVGPLEGPMEHYPALIKSRLMEADIRLGHCERLYSDKGTNQNNGHAYNRLDPSWTSLFSDCGFDVLSVSGNHALDMGPEAYLDTLANLHARGIKTVGGGANINEARQPAIVEKNGVRVAFLGYGSIVKEGYAATEKRAGIAPMRAETFYSPLDAQPGIPARPVTIAHAGDLAALEDDVRKARAMADAVVVAMHWGVHYVPHTIADYEITVGNAAFAAGADLIVGHHAHLPKGIRVHDGKVCFHNLGTFIMTAPPFTPAQQKKFETMYGVQVDPAYPKLRYGTDAKQSMIAKAVIGSDGISEVSYIPVQIDPQLRPVAVAPGSPAYAEVTDFLAAASRQFETVLTDRQGDVHVLTDQAAAP